MPTRYVNTASTAGGDGTTNATEGANRAYVCLSDAEAGLPADITTGGDQGVWTIICEGSAADTTAVTFNGTTTSATYYIEVKTDPNASSGYGRHDGKWNDNKYRLVHTSADPLSVYDLFIRFTGLQVYKNSSANYRCGVNCAYVATTSYIQLSYCIFRGTGAEANSYQKLINGPSPGTMEVFNTVCYSMASADGAAIRPNGGTANIYSSDFSSVVMGVYRGGTSTVTLINCLFNSCTNDLSGTATNTYCSTTNDSTKGLNGAGTGNRFSQTFSFVDSANGNFHLQTGDTGAKDYGLSDPGSGLFSDDIDGQTRSGTWDIGADEYVASYIPFPFSRGARGGIAAASGGLQ